MRRRLSALVAVATCICGTSAARAQRPLTTDSAVGMLEPMYAQVVARPAVRESALDGCVTIYDIWKPQVLALHDTPPRSEERVTAFEQRVRQPYEHFWHDYIGATDSFDRWVRDRLEVGTDARRVLPTRLDVGTLIAETTTAMTAFTGRRACGDWYAVFGPGRTDMGSLGNRRMVIDFLGMPPDIQPDEVRFTLAHEVNHLIFGERRASDPYAGTVLYRMIDEGFAVYVAHHFADAAASPARALSWTDEQLTWALQHEKELWTMLQRYFESEHGDVHDAFFMYDQQVRPGAPGKIGYFLGYRIIESYVQRNGPESWRGLYDMDVAEILLASRIVGDRVLGARSVSR
jgi:hypothetical protein